MHGNHFIRPSRGSPREQGRKQDFQGYTRCQVDEYYLPTPHLFLSYTEKLFKLDSFTIKFFHGYTWTNLINITQLGDELNFAKEKNKGKLSNCFW